MSNITDERFQVKCDFRNKNAIQMLAKAMKVLNRMENNPHFPSPNPYLEKLAVCTARLKVIVARNETRLEKTQTDHAKREVTDALRSVASQVMCLSAGKGEIILSSGFDLRKKRSKAQILPAPVIKRSQKLQKKGCMKLMWKAIISSRMYKIYLSEAGKPESRKRIAVSTKSSCIITGLQSGKIYQLEVSASNTAGESPLSLPITVLEAWL